MTVAPDRIVQACHDIGARPSRADIEGVDLFWAEKGEGPCILAIHGLSSCFFTWRSLFQGLGHAFRVIAPDLPGFGCSGDDPRGEYGLDFFSRVLAGLVRRNECGPLTVCGHSYGGLIAWMLAVMYPEMVERMILIAPPVPGGDRSQDATVEYLMLYAYADLSSIESTALDVYRAAGIRTPLPLKGRKSFPTIQPMEDRKGIPCLLMWGEKDRIVRPETASFWSRHHGISALSLYEGVGHCPHEESPGEFILQAFDFIQQT